MKYVNLHCHTHYSGLDGIGSPKEYMDRAAEIGMKYMAITDHGTTMGHREWQREAKRTGIISILGIEGYQTNDRFDKTSKAKRADGDLIYNHLTLLSQNETGLRNLNRISEVAWTEGFYSKPRFDFDVLEENSDGVIALSGCMSGMIPKAIEAGDKEKVQSLVKRYLSIFGDRFFIEIMSSNPKELNLALLSIAEKYKILPVVTDDCHHVRKEDLWVQEATLILNTSPSLNKDFDFNKSQKMDFIDRFNYMYPERMSFQDFDLFLHTYDEHVASLSKHGIGIEPIENTVIVAEMIGEYPYYQGLDLLPDPKSDPKEMLRKKVYQGLKRLGKNDDQIYVDRVEHELEIIGNLGLESYFLILENAIAWAESKDIMVGPGRGSGVSSLVNYCLSITRIDPLENNLLFFRFLTPPSTTMIRPEFELIQ